MKPKNLTVKASDFTYSISGNGITVTLGWLEPDHKFIVVVETETSEDYFFPKRDLTLLEARQFAIQVQQCFEEIYKAEQ